MFFKNYCIKCKNVRLKEQGCSLNRKKIYSCVRETKEIESSFLKVKIKVAEEVLGDCSELNKNNDCKNFSRNWFNKEISTDKYEHAHYGVGSKCPIIEECSKGKQCKEVEKIGGAFIERRRK